MRGDVTRQTFRSGKHYRGVLQQQGRVQLDADWNEQVDIQAYVDRTVTADLVGVSGAPRRNPGMEITDKAGNPLPANLDDADLYISAGHYYVDGILCENDDTVSVAEQPDLPGVVFEDREKRLVGEYVAYLDVWFEHITRLEEPLLQEVALGGPDTTTRSRTVWQVRLRPATEPQPPGATDRKATMRATVVEPTPSEKATPCIIGPAARYRRLENQLYRVEVFDETVPDFLWSRENSSVAAAVTDIDGASVTIAAPGRDDRLAFQAGNVVELTNLSLAHRREHGYLGKLVDVDGRGTGLTVTWIDRAPTKADLPDHPVLRRWDSTNGPQRLFPDPREPIELEGGIHVEFTDGVYRTGDYWLIPARTANLDGVPGVVDLAGDIQWPDGTFQPPDGVVHHYADIAHLTWKGDKWSVDDDCRRIFDPIADRLDVTVAGGDGQEAMPREWLDEPVRVAVTRGLRPVRDETVQFYSVDEKGELSATAGAKGGDREVEVYTDGEGLAQCWWRPDPDGPPTQRVTARLVDTEAKPKAVPTGPALGFTASLSVADRVAFDPESCAAMSGATTVQEALRRLADVSTLVPVGGNGQIAVADATLPTTVKVLVRSCGEPVQVPRKVRFAITEGGVARVGDPPAAPSVDIETDATGVADCTWQLGREVPLQTLTATLLASEDNPDPRAVPLTFVAGVVPDVLTVRRVELPAGSELAGGALVVANDLAAKGIFVVFDREPAPSVEDGPALTVTLDLPFPLSQSDRDLWPDGVAGTLPVGLDGSVTVTTVGGSPAVSWSPSDGAKAFLTALFAKLGAVGRDRVGGKVRLAGSVLGAGAADAARWFWLVEKVTQPVFVPHRDGRLRLPSTLGAIARSVSRDALRAGLASGVTVEDVPADPEKAKQLARFIFNTTRAPKRPLRLVVDARYAAAGAAVRDGLATLDIEVELLNADDPADEATTRLAAGETIDGVLTDAASAAAVDAVAGFIKPVRL